jgi:hypothetical protein
MRAEAVSSPFPSAALPRGAARGMTVGITTLIVAHLVLAALIQISPTRAEYVGTVHAFGTIAVGCWAMLRWKPIQIAYVAAYAAGSDVLWRMTGAHVPWEVAKYLVVLLSICGILRMGQRARWNYLALIYFVALLPSIGALLQYQGHSESVVQSLSFNLSGPLCLCASAWYMSQLRLSRRDLRNLLLCLIAPILTIAAVTLLATYSAKELSFTDESSIETSGGFGPNQVSAMLGLGALATLILAVDPRQLLRNRAITIALLLVFLVQSAMTFSRGGLYSFGVSFLVAGVFFVGDATARKWLFRISAVVAVISASFLLPRLENFTGGALGIRFADTDPGQRSEIVQEDMRLFQEHPVLGVGPGVARSERRGEFKIAHTEYSRMLSEHGLFGVIALIALLALSLSQVLRREPIEEKAVRLALLAWGLTSMLHVGMRIAAVGLIFGWGCSRSLLNRERLQSQPYHTTDR